MNDFTLFADGEWMRLLVPLIFFVIWAAQQIAAANMQKPKARGAVRPKQPQAPDALRREIDAYVKETRQRQQQQKPQKEKNRQRKPRKPRPVAKQPKPVAAESKIAARMAEHEQHVHDVFDHAQLPATASSSAAQKNGQEPREQSSKLAAEIVAMLRKPESVRRAMILNEILERPKF